MRVCSSSEFQRETRGGSSSPYMLHLDCFSGSSCSLHLICTISLLDVPLAQNGVGSLPQSVGGVDGTNARISSAAIW